MAISLFELRMLAVYQFGFLYQAETLTTIYANKQSRQENETVVNPDGFFKFFESGKFYMPSDELQDYPDLQKLVTSNAVLFHTIGWFIGSAIAGPLSYSYGRKPVVVFALAAGGVIITLNACVREYATFAVLRFLLGIISGLYLVSSWALISELIQPTSRLPARAFSNWPNARFIHAIVVFTIGNWRLSVFFSAVSSFGAAALFYYCVPESPIWMANVGKTEECQQTQEMITKTYDYEIHVSSVPSTRVSLWSILKSRSFLPTLILLAVFWLSTPYINFTTDLGSSSVEGLSLETKQILMPLIMAASKMTVGCIEINTRPFKRTHMQIFVYTSLLAVTVGSIIGSTDLITSSKLKQNMNIICYLSAMTLSEFCWDICYLVTVEVVPTELRSAVLSFGSTIARMGYIIATVSDIELGKVKKSKQWIQPTILAVICLLNLVLGFGMLKNTQNVQLAEVTTTKVDNDEDRRTTAALEENLSVKKKVFVH